MIRGVVVVDVVICGSAVAARKLLVVDPTDIICTRNIFIRKNYTIDNPSIFNKFLGFFATSGCGIAIVNVYLLQVM